MKSRHCVAFAVAIFAMLTSSLTYGFSIVPARISITGSARVDFTGVPPASYQCTSNSRGRLIGDIACGVAAAGRQNSCSFSGAGVPRDPSITSGSVTITCTASGRSFKASVFVDVPAPATAPPTLPSTPANGGLTNASCSNSAVVVKFWDYAEQDNDRVTISLNNETLVSNFDMNQCGGPNEPAGGPCVFARSLPVNSNVPVTVFAHTEGSISPNTASLKVIGNCSPESQQWRLATGGSAGITIHTGAGGSVPPSTPLSAPPSLQSAYVYSAGRIPSTAVQVNASGTFGSASLRVFLDILSALQSVPSTGFAASVYNVYVIAMVPGQQVGSPIPLLFTKPKAPGTWRTLQFPIAPFLEDVAQNSANNLVLIEILSVTDISALAGTEIYVGYGLSDQEMLAAGRYRGVFKAQ